MSKRSAGDHTTALYHFEERRIQPSGETAQAIPPDGIRL
jgi:hypothetical protein